MTNEPTSLFDAPGWVGLSFTLRLREWSVPAWDRMVNITFHNKEQWRGFVCPARALSRIWDAVIALGTGEDGLLGFGTESRMMESRA